MPAYAFPLLAFTFDVLSSPVLHKTYIPCPLLDPRVVSFFLIKSARRRSSSVVVQTKILAKDAAAVTTMKSTLGLGDALKTKLNAALKKEKLKESTFVTAPVTGSAAVLSRSTASTTNMLTTALTLTVLARM